MILILIFSASVINAQTEDRNPLEITVEKMYSELYNELDISKINHYFTGDFSGFREGEIIDRDNIQSIIENLVSTFHSEEDADQTITRINTFQFSGSEIERDTGIIYYKISSQFKINDIPFAELSWLESAYMKKENEDWKITFLHTTREKE